ncbi:hypothetical protein BDV97DRAFT_370535 [Delphinella strobiligena]|nr:hypothetical protein BDV97DRAFT_370535 [Delphinella strobiligena]
MWDVNDEKINFYVASRGHHAEIAGTHPGSMPSDSQTTSDLKAAIVANQKGAQLINSPVEEYTLPVAEFYMDAIKANAEVAVRNFLEDIDRERGGEPLAFSDFVDDGTEIRLSITIDKKAVMSLRALINTDIPRDQGCLVPVTVVIPEGTLLNPCGYSAVCAGNPSRRNESRMLCWAPSEHPRVLQYPVLRPSA